MTGLTWLNDLMLWFGRWFPRLVLVQAGNVGVWYGLAGRIKTVQPGLCIYWPITSNLVVVSTRERTSEIASQLHGGEVVALILTYTITDAERILLHFNDIFSQLDDRLQDHLARAYSPEASNETICEQVKEAMWQDFGPFGVAIHRVNVAQRGRVIALKNLNDWAQHAAATL